MHREKVSKALCKRIATNDELIDHEARSTLRQRLESLRAVILSGSIFFSVDIASIGTGCEFCHGNLQAIGHIWAWFVGDDVSFLDAKSATHYLYYTQPLHFRSLITQCLRSIMNVNVVPDDALSIKSNGTTMMKGVYIIKFIGVIQKSQRCNKLEL